MRKIIKYVFLMFIIMILDISVAKAESWNGQVGVIKDAVGNPCGGGEWCFNDERYGLRFSIVSKEGNVKGTALDIFYQGNEGNAPVPHVNRFGGSNSFATKRLFWFHKDNKTEYIATPRTDPTKSGCKKSNGCADVGNSQALALLINDYKSATKNYKEFSMIKGGDTSNYDSTIHTRINNLGTNSAAFTRMKQLMNLGNVTLSVSDYLVVEPISVVIHNVGNLSYYYYGTAYELDAFLLTNANTYNHLPKLRTLIYARLGRAMQSKEHTISPLTIPKKWPSLYNDTTKEVEKNKELWGKYPYGTAIYKVPDLDGNMCRIDVNTNSDSKYNWTYFDANCDANADGVIDGCWRKIDKGCCDTALSDYTFEEIAKKYPACAETMCQPEIQKTKNPVCSTQSASLYSEMKYLKGTTTAIPNYCLATNNYFTYKTASWRVGCRMDDNVTLPRSYSGVDISIGSYFIWPTSENAFLAGKISQKDYDIYRFTRTSNVYCLVYGYDENGNIKYPGKVKEEEYNDAVNTIKSKLSGNFTLTYNDTPNGELEIEKTEVINNNKFENFVEKGVKYRAYKNSKLDFKIKSSYSLKNTESKPSGIYAYFGYEQNKYLNYFPTSVSENYGFPIIHIGNPGDKGLITAKYGINYSNVFFGQLKYGGGSYNCQISTNKPIPPPDECVCPPGTKYAGISLEEIIGEEYQPSKCNSYKILRCDNGPLYCKHQKDFGAEVTYENVTDKVNDYISNGLDATSAYNRAAIESCPGPTKTCIDKDGNEFETTSCINSKLEINNYPNIQDAIDDCELEVCGNGIPGKYYCPKYTANKYKEITNCVTPLIETKGEAMAMNSCIKTECGNNQKADIIYRTIFLNDPFPGINGTGRTFIGANWNGNEKLYIKDTNKYMYEGTPMYSFKLTPTIIKKIRQYNSNNEYDDFKLENKSNQYRLSEVLRNEFSEAFVGGACKSATAARKIGDEDCRLQSFKS